MFNCVTPKGFDQISIPLDSSQAIWLKLRVPEQTLPGLYRGQINILQAGTVQTTVPLELEVLPLRLDPPKTRASAFHDPYYKIFASNTQRKVFELFRDVGFDPFIFNGMNSFDGKEIKDPTTNRIIDFDFTLFDKRLQRFIDERIINQNPIYIYIGTLANSILKFLKVAGSENKPEKIRDIYSKLSEPDFKNAFILGIKKIEAIGEKHGITFAFSAVDEPGFDPYLRIFADRLYTHLKENNSLTVLTYSAYCDEEINSGNFFQTPTGKIPPLTDLINYKLWEISQQVSYGAHDGSILQLQHT